MKAFLTVLVLVLAACGNADSVIQPTPEKKAPPVVVTYKYGSTGADSLWAWFSSGWMKHEHDTMLDPTTSRYLVARVDSGSFNNARFGAGQGILLTFKQEVFKPAAREAWSCNCMIIPLTGEWQSAFYADTTAAEVWTNHYNPFLERYVTFEGLGATSLAEKLATLMTPLPENR
jgi:hypothetical protein